MSEQVTRTDCGGKSQRESKKEGEPPKSLGVTSDSKWAPEGV